MCFVVVDNSVTDTSPIETVKMPGEILCLMAWFFFVSEEYYRKMFTAVVVKLSEYMCNGSGIMLLNFGLDLSKRSLGQKIAFPRNL